ncbi:hypothetical protein [Enterococcus cecorum]|uniref:hypothetical protein n=1 Tax=Enterococcus cecorum TaxID=44008 RepID=UPI0006429909|nr:hypothetical protein [Enterococcus cecorum]KLO69103.1 hypothetical protein AA987_09355 [Enterococcus cecorum]CAI3300107.1 hypothetical protein CIRMBP1207_00666 [Enterococcus cecorum]CAI3332306.1 hypothetical protein CIRMBP1212_00969 [Enterococcus cecorum]CAI3349455.1 hypothetical protein CIRMBP1214_01126 [Enterococcus cecorum]CAI3470533.1 hypothetical protein CIRMBP1313_01407 [Enterococcus cecorum]
MKKSVLNGMLVTLLVTSLGLASCQQTKKTESKTTTSSKVIKKKSTKDKKKKTKTSSSTTESTTKKTIETKEKTTQSKTTTSQAPQAEKTKTSTPAKPAAQPTILDTLVGKNFVFSSGSGGWGSSLSIGAKGTFSGDYHDSDMGSTGPGYPGGTVSESKVSGQFTRAHQVSPTLYEVYLENLQYEKPVGSSEIKDNVKYEYTEAYGISKNTRMAIYLPGTLISSMPEELRLYSYGLIPEDSQTLPVYVIQGDMEGFFIEYH